MRNGPPSPVRPLVVLECPVPRILSGSTTGPIARQVVVLGVVWGTRFTGTVTVSAIPHPEPRSPWVMTREPDSTSTLTLGPRFESSDRRIAEVPPGTVPLGWHPDAPPGTDSRKPSITTEFVPATVGGE